MYLRDYLRQLFTLINNADLKNIRIIENNLTLYLKNPSKYDNTHTDLDIIEYLVEWQLIDHQNDGLRLDFINTEDKEDANPNDTRLKLPGYSSIYQFLLEESNKAHCLPQIKSTIINILHNINTLCTKNNRTASINKAYTEYKNKKQLQEEAHNQAINHSSNIEQQVAQKYSEEMYSLPDTYNVSPGLFWITVDYICENPEKILLGMLLASVLVAGVTFITLGSCGIGLLGLCAAGTAIVGAGLTVSSLAGSGALLGYSLFSYPEGKSTIVDGIEDFNLAV